ncbi:hypothetical protein T492DRAFT_1106464, partial [Pavlovales sp. CCMP2436]
FQNRRQRLKRDAGSEDDVAVQRSTMPMLDPQELAFSNELYGELRVAVELRDRAMPLPGGASAAFGWARPGGLATGPEMMTLPRGLGGCGFFDPSAAYAMGVRRQFPPQQDMHPHAARLLTQGPPDFRTDAIAMAAAARAAPGAQPPGGGYGFDGFADFCGGAPDPPRQHEAHWFGALPLLQPGAHDQQRGGMAYGHGPFPYGVSMCEYRAYAQPGHPSAQWPPAPPVAYDEHGGVHPKQPGGASRGAGEWGWTGGRETHPQPQPLSTGNGSGNGNGAADNGAAANGASQEQYPRHFPGNSEDTPPQAPYQWQ